MSVCRFGVSPANYPDPDPDSRAFVCLFARDDFCPSSFPLGVAGLAAAFDCGTPWNFVLIYFDIHTRKKLGFIV